MLLIGFALFLPRLLIPFNKAWLKFGDVIHRIVSPLIMSVIFFCIITPIGVVMRLFGKEFLQLRQDPTALSYWIDCQGINQRSQSMKQQF